MQRTLRIFAAAALVAAPAMTFAASTIDGSFDSGYGALGGANLKGLQAAPTQFGDAGPTSGGSEIDAAYAYIEGHTLYLLATGNLENNFNKIDVFLKTHSGGANVVPALSGDSGEFGHFTGMKLDAAFAPNYLLAVGYGGGTAYANLANLNTANETYIGNGPAGTTGTVFTGGNTVGPNILFAVDNSNAAGVTGTTADPAAALAVTTGVEFSFDLSGMGWDGGDVQAMVAINGSGDDFFSNQFIGSLPSNYGNLGNPGSVDLSAADGNQYFTVAAPAAVPEPASAALLALPAVALVARRRRSV